MYYYLRLQTLSGTRAAVFTGLIGGMTSVAIAIVLL